MKIRRTAARAKNGAVYEVEFKGIEFSTRKNGNVAVLVMQVSDVLEFGTKKTHYVYEIEITLSELVDLVTTAAESKDEIRESVKKEIGPCLGKFIKMISMCSE